MIPEGHDVAWTSKKRLLAAMTRSTIPDRVPVSPDTSHNFPARHTGRPFWEVFLERHPPLWKAYLDLAEAYDFDLCLEFNGLVGYEEHLAGGTISVNTDGNVPLTARELARGEQGVEMEYTYHTRKGDLTRVLVFPRRDAPWCKQALVTDPEGQAEQILALLVDPRAKSGSAFQEVHTAIGQRGVLGPRIQVPTSWWFFQRKDYTEAIYDYYDHPQLMETIMKGYTEYALEEVRASCELLGADEIVFGGCNASLAIISPAMYRKWNLPFLRQATAICKRYGIPSHNHVGGKSALLIEMLTTTDMTVVEPLERPPSGDTPLAEMKLKYGQRFCLKGNVNTFGTLQYGSAKQVLAESLRCIRDAGSGGGFVLSSGDQVPLETPEANLSAMVEAAHELGGYPLDMPAIEKAIEEAESGRRAAS